MEILYINNNGGGFADKVYVDEGTTLAEFFEHRKEESRSSNAVIRVNREIQTADYVLEDGDRVTITPTKMSGAR